MRDQIQEFLLNRVAEVFRVDAATLSLETSFVDDLKAKSANLVQITTALEDEYDVEIRYMEFARKKTIGEALDYVEALVEA